jgi:hypothetical protein
MLFFFFFIHMDVPEKGGRRGKVQSRRGGTRGGGGRGRGRGKASSDSERRKQNKN